MNSIRSITLVALLAALGAGSLAAQKPSQASVLLQAADQKATLEGDLRGAISLYEQVVNQFARTDRPAVATALLRMSECYEKLGDPRASRVLEQLLSQYSDQAGSAATARARLGSGMPRLICEECADAFGTISVDGRAMVSTQPYLGSAGDRAGDLGVMELSSNRLTPLEIEGSGKGATGVAITGVFSPDGKHIVYTWAQGDVVELRVVPREPKGKMRVLVARGSQYGIMLPLAWSTAGSILTIAQKADQTLDLVMISAANGAMTVVKSLGFRVSPGPHIASVSADGKFLAHEELVTDPGIFQNQQRTATLDRQIHVVSADGSADVAITTGAGVKRYPVWTPSGSHVLYISNVAGAWDLWAVPMKGGKPTGSPVLVKKNVGDVVSVGMSANGVYHFYEGRSGVFRTTVTPVAGTKSTSNAADSFVGERPAWSPDGTRVAVSRPRADGGAGVDVVVRTLATGEERVFKRDGILPFPFMWFPGGTALLVQVRESPNVQFWYRLNFSSGSFERLVQQRGNPAFWTHQNIRTLSADGRTLYFGTYASQTDSQLDRITALDLQSGSYRDVVKLPYAKENLPTAAQDLTLVSSPDGRSLAVMAFDHKTNVARLAIVGVDGQGYRELLPSVDATNLRNKLAWSRDGRWIYYSTRTGKPDDDTHRVMRVAATGGAPEPAGLDAVGLECFDVSPDGTRIAYSTLRPEGWGQLLWALDVSWLMKAPR